jgi:hypothetical protein
MVDPLTLVLISVASGSAFGWVGSWFMSDHAALQRKIEALEKEVDRQESNSKWLRERNDQVDKALVEKQAEATEYRRMAETHEVKLPPPPEPGEVQTGTLWKDRLFSNHPQMNLTNLERELKSAGVWGKDINLRIELLGSALGGGTGFSRAIEKSWLRDGKKTKDIGPWVYHGTARRAMEDLKTFIMDDDTGLMKGVKKKDWVDKDSALVFKVSVDVTEVIEPPPLPEIHVVEVPVVEVRYVEVEVEKPIFVSVPKGQEAELCGHSPAEIRELVQDELARHDAEREVESLGRLAGMDVDAEKKRLGKAKAKQGRKA